MFRKVQKVISMFLVVCLIISCMVDMGVKKVEAEGLSSFHEHLWKFSENANVISATCTNGDSCNLGVLTATLTLDSEYFYGSTITPTITLSEGWTEVNNFTSIPTTADVTYVGRGNTVYAKNSQAPVDLGSYTAVLTIGDNIAEYDFDIVQAIPTITINPSASAITFGQKLAESILIGGKADVEGSFAWADKDFIPNINDSDLTEFDVIFTPDDRVHYGENETCISLKINPMTQDAPDLSSFTVSDAAYATSGDGKIEIKSDNYESMEYSTDDGAKWNPVSDKEICGLNPGKIMIRFVANDYCYASDSVIVTVGNIALSTAKKTARDNLDALLSEKNQTDYDEDDWTTITNAINDGKKAIDGCSSTDDITTTLGRITAEVSAIMTKEQKAEETLATAKKKAKDELDALLSKKNQTDYDKDDWTTITTAITDGKNEIDGCTSTDDITTTLGKIIAEVSAIKTKTEKAEETLATAKKKAKDDLDALLKGKNQNDYDEAEWTAILNIISNAKERIETCITTSGVTEILNNAKNAVNSTKTKNDKNARENNINIVAIGSYTGFAQAAVITGANLYSTNGTSFSYKAPEFTDAGEYTVYYKTSTDSVVRTAICTITPAEVDPIWNATNPSYGFDGTAKTVKVTGITHSTLSQDILNKFDPNGVKYTYEFNGRFVESCVNKGTYNVTAILDKYNKNFTLASNNTVTLTITACTVVATAKDAVADYDGKAHSIDKVTLNSPEGSYKVVYATASNGTFSDTIPTFIEEGTYKIYYKVVDPDVEYTGDDKENYTIPNELKNGRKYVTLTIKPALTVKRTDSTAKSVTYTGKAYPITAKAYSGTAEESDVKVVIYASKNSGDYTKVTDGIKAVGTYRFAYALVIDGKEGSKVLMDDTVTIQKASIAKAKVTTKTLTYNAKSQKAVVTKVILDGRTLKAGTDYTVATVKKTNAGTYSVKVTGKGNYTGAKTAKFKINKLKASKLSVIRKGNTYTVCIGKKKVSTSNYKLTAEKVGKKFKVTITGKKNITGKTTKTVK